jgi:hypothetical protein
VDRDDDELAQVITEAYRTVAPKSFRPRRRRTHQRRNYGALHSTQCTSGGGRRQYRTEPVDEANASASMS